jgi:lipoprotein-releasing system permease protein
MAFSLELAIRYVRSKKRAFVSVGTMFAILGVVLGVAALTIVVSVTGGFLKEFQDKVLGVNAHVLVLKHSTDFREYREVIEKVEHVKGVTGVAPFVISPMMLTHGEHTATGVLLKGIDPDRMPSVLDLPKHIVRGSLVGLRRQGAEPPKRQRDPLDFIGEAADIDTGTASLIVGDKPAESPNANEGDRGRSARPTETQAGNSSKRSTAGRKGLLTAIKDTQEELAAAPERGKNQIVHPSQKQESQREQRATATAPSGNVEPVGGYQSLLPDDDVLPPEFVEDPCKIHPGQLALPGIVIGKTLRENLHANLGDCIQVASPTIGYSISGGVIRAPVAKQFQVVAVFDAGFDQYDSKIVYTDLYESQGFLGAGDSVTGVEMRIADIDKAKSVAHEIDEKLDNGIYRTMDWEELNHGLFTALTIQKILISLVLALIIIVAAFTVVATLIMVVLEKRREIAIIKALGASDGTVLRAFLYQGGFIGMVGTGFGIILGYFGCRALMRYEFPLDPGVYFISRLPVRMQPTEFLLVGIFALLVCLVATVWPARYAAQLRPADAFREQH